MSLPVEAATRSPWTEDPRLPEGDDLLPVGVDVAVVGGGLAGLGAAALLAEGGARVVLLEARPRLGQGLLAREAGLVALGHGEAPARLEAAIGAERVGQIARFCHENLAMLEELGCLTRGGVLHAARSAREAEALPADLAALERAGVKAEAWDGATIERRMGVVGLPGGLFLPEEGWIDPPALVAALADRARRAGALLFTNSRVGPIEEGPTLHLGARRLQAELVVLAGGHPLTTLDAWFEDKLLPVRTQLRATGQGAIAPWSHGLRLQLGYSFVRTTADGRAIVGGCRWATPHLEAGETDEGRISPLVDQRLAELIAAHLPALARLDFPLRWSGIQTHTCDRLPIIGPLPGRPRLLAAVGFEDRDASMGLRAARALADGILSGHASGLPEGFAPSRFT